MIWYNRNSDSDKNEEFINVDLFCNKISIQLLANDSITHFKKCQINKSGDDTNEALKTNTAKKKKASIKRIGKKSSKASVFILGLVDHLALNI